MENQDLDERSRFKMLGCITTAMRMTGRHARTVLDRIRRLFSGLNCMTVEFEEGGRRYSRKLTKKEKAMVVDKLQQGLDSMAKDRASRSSSYDSLADETLSIRASTLTSPATSIGYASESSSAQDVRTPSSLLEDTRTRTNVSFSYKSITPQYSPVFNTPVQAYVGTTYTEYTPRRTKSLSTIPDIKDTLVPTPATTNMTNELTTQMANKVTTPVTNAVTSEVPNVLPSLPGSVLSYYKSTPDITADGFDDDGFWDIEPPKSPKHY